jgi:hypothetical protein
LQDPTAKWNWDDFLDVKILCWTRYLGEILCLFIYLFY